MSGINEQITNLMARILEPFEVPEEFIPGPDLIQCWKSTILEAIPGNCPTPVRHYIEKCVPAGWSLGGPVEFRSVESLLDETHEATFPRLLPQRFLIFAFRSEELDPDGPLQFYAWDFADLQVLELPEAAGCAQSRETVLESATKEWPDMPTFLQWALDQQPDWLEAAQQKWEQEERQHELEVKAQAQFESKFATQPEYGCARKVFGN